MRPVTASPDRPPDGLAPWWKTAVIYQIYPRSFATSTGRDPVARKVGDLAGIRSRLDHLEWLGVDAIWLSPVFPSPMKDYGYDVSDYCDIEPLFGTLDDFDALVADAHDRGIKVVLDFVPNHTSDQHPWFQASRSSRDDPKRDWYVWRDPAPDGGPPNNWVASFVNGPAWTFDDATGQYYLHNFLPEQPDLNWANPDVVEAMHDALRFWLDRGVDGFRVDVVHLIGKGPDLPDDAEELLPIPHSALNDRPETHALLRDLRALLDSYPGDRMMVGEVFLLDTKLVATYYGDDDELHLSFNFPPLFTPWDAPRWRKQIEITAAELDPVGAWPTWVLSNHDQPRHRTRYGSEARARAAAVLLAGLRGTPFLYAGEELGLEDAVIPPDRVVDPGGRDGCRAPVPWTPDPEHGWGTTDPWLPWPPDAATRNLDTSRADDSSILHLYRRLLACRHSSPALQLGSLVLLDDGPGDAVVGWTRTFGDDARTVLINFTDRAQRVDGVVGVVEVASDGVGEGAGFTGELGPDQAVILRGSS
jgi:alpha-glucosidase